MALSGNMKPPDQPKTHGDLLFAAQTRAKRMFSLNVALSWLLLLGFIF